MLLRLRLYILLLLVCCISDRAFASLDREIMESRKCSSMFSYFENRYNLPKDILYSISLQETQKSHTKHNIGVVWPWTINVEGKGFHFKTKKDAVRFVKEQMALGKTSIDVGCMQINLKHHPKAFSNLDQAFSPRQNIAYAAELLLSHYNRLGNWTKAVGEYHSATRARAVVYSTSVSRINNKMPDYKQDLKKFAYSSEFISRKSVNPKLQNLRERYVSMNKSNVQVRVGKLKNNDLFRAKVKR